MIELKKNWRLMEICARVETVAPRFFPSPMAIFVALNESPVM